VVPPIAAGIVALVMSAEIGSAPVAAPDTPLRIDCATLDRESRGALEARARAEIALQPEPAGTIVVVCSDTFGAFAAFRYVLSQGPFALAAGPDLIVLARPVVVDVFGAELFRVPRVVAGLSIGGTADLVR
jgi:hypothetical protein